MVTKVNNWVFFTFFFQMHLIWIIVLLLFQLRQSQSYCTDTECPMECMYDTFFIQLSLDLVCSYVGGSLDLLKHILKSKNTVWTTFQYSAFVQCQVQVPEEEELSWPSPWLWWDGWCWLYCCFCCALQVSEVLPQGNPSDPTMSVLITLLHSKYCLTTSWP